MPRLFVDNLTVIDCSILDPERGLIGASWAVNVELMGELDHQSMVFDFSKVKKTIKHIIDNEVDHKLLVPNQYSGLTLKEKNRNTEFDIQFNDDNGQLIQHRSPIAAICQIPAEAINQQTLTDFLQRILIAALPSNVEALKVSLHEESIAGNYYCYSHGLKKHAGNCQRIAHGHRSQIQIWHNAQRSEKLEKNMASLWHDIYLGSTEDISNETKHRITFAYTTDQGDFEIQLPRHRVHLMPCDSTIECIAEHILGLLKAQYPNDSITVKAFEGISKGAIASIK